MAEFEHMDPLLLQMILYRLPRAPALRLLSSCQLFGGWKTIRHAKRLGMQSKGRPRFDISDLTLPMSAQHHPNWSCKQREELDAKLFFDLSMTAYKSRAEVLILSGFECYIVNVFAAIKPMPRLLSVELHNFPKLRSIPHTWPDINLIAANIRKLTIKGCEQLQIIDVQSWHFVRSLEIESCGLLTTVDHFDGDSVSGLQKLNTLSITDCPDLSIIYLQLHALPNLTTLRLHNNDTLTSLQLLPRTITQLTISHCNQFTLLDVSSGEKIKTLELQECEQLQIVDGLESLKELRSLEIHWCNQLSLALLPLKELFTECPLLKTVQISYNGYVGDEFHLPDFKQLEEVAKHNNVLFSHFKFA